MIGTDNTWDAFITEHRWAVLTTLRISGEPVSSVVAYAREGDQLVVSTPGHTFKRSSIERDARVNLCIVNDKAPFNFVAVEAIAKVDATNLVDSTRRVFANIAQYDYKEPDDLSDWLKKQARVVLRLTWQRVYGVIR